MQNTATDMRLQTGETVRPTGISRRSSNTGDVQMADPFMQIIMNLISQYADETPQAQGEAGTQSTQGLSAVLAELGSGEGQSNGAQMAQLMSLLPTMQFSQTKSTGELSQLLGAQTGGLESEVLGQMSSTAYQQLFESVLDSVTESGKAPDASAILQMLSMQSTADGSDPMQLLATTQNAQTIAELLAAKLDGKAADTTNVQQLINELAEGEKFPVKSVEGGESSGEAEAQGPKDMFSSAVDKARELLSKQTEKTEAELNAQAATGLESKPVTPFELRFKSAEKPLEVPVSEQISGGIKENLSLGKSEFTVKLNPESLGEITVKLAEEAGKTTLTITTASAQTAKLINSDMDALKAAVAPMNVQVNEAVTQSEASQQGGMQQFDMTGQFASQQQASQQFAAQQSFLRMTQGRQSSGAQEMYTPDITAAAALSAVTTGRLDAYI